MANFNKVLLMGNLTRDPQLKYLPSQTPVVEFGLASNRKFRTGSGEDREDVLFIDCSAFGRQAEVINQYCQKGKPIFVEGRLKLDTWEDRQGGGKRSKISVVVENFQFLGGRGDEGDAGGGGGYSGGRGRGGYDQEDSGGGGYQSRSRAPRRDAEPARQADSAPTTPTTEPFDDQEQFGEDDIPF